MKVIPVLDLLDGQVVHGVQGKRETYCPIKSKIVKSSEPLDIVQVFGRRFGFTQFYLADLNAILNKGNNFDIFRDLKRKFPSFSFMADLGVRNISDIMNAGVNLVNIFILGTETIESLSTLDRILENVGFSKIIISLDLMNGKFIHIPSGFKDSLKDFVQIITSRKLSQIIVLDLAKVGSNSGPLYPEIEIIQKSFAGEVIAGGGVRDARDLADLEKYGYGGALVATALHSGRVTAHDIASCLGKNHNF